MPFFYYFDPTYFLVIIGMVLSLLASAKVKSTFARYSKERKKHDRTDRRRNGQKDSFKSRYL